MSDQKTNDEAELVTQAITRMLSEGSAGILVTLLRLPSAGELRIGAKLLTIESGECIGTLGAAELDEAVIHQAREFNSAREATKTFQVEEFAPALGQFHGALLLFERIEAEPRLVIAGAGHVGAALARLAVLVGYRVTLIDDRSEFLNRELFAAPAEQGIDLVVAEDWQDTVRESMAGGRGVSLAIVTRGHKQDEDCLRAAISTKSAYIGMIGSKRRTNIVLDKLRAEGADPDQLKRVRAPIGLDIGAVSPEEVALAILAEIVAERRGGSGSSLSNWRRK